MQAPRRAFHIDIIAGADTREELHAMLQRFLDEFSPEVVPAGKGSIGGAASAMSYMMSIDPLQTRERYLEQLQAFMKQNLP